MINIDKKLGRINLNLKAMYVGEDLLIVLSGGDRPHIGGLSYGGLEDKSNTISFKNHKDHILSDLLSKEISKIFKGNFLICSGVHLDNITKEEINQVKKLSEEILEEMIFIMRENKKWI
ncbi:prenylated flavin chaperone LpdD [Terrisporobacter sp.]|uniref:prenylated flavin chaperone LpdD n=1 Tax=Terrisporobacter sp. TaxID=1965305 RepID=UPI00260DC6A3|nr:hypothetical protein [Terrisporobacter sp.]